MAGWCRRLDAFGESVWAVPGACPVYAPPLVLANGAVLFADDRGTVTLREGATGRKRWATSLPGGKVFGRPASLGGGRLVVATTGGRVYVVSDDDGSILASYDLGAETFSSPVVVGGRVFIGCRDDALHALDLGA